MSRNTLGDKKKLLSFSTEYNFKEEIITFN